MWKRFLLGFVVGVVLIVVAGVGASRLKQDTTAQARYQAELEGATPVEIGVLTDRQRIHSKLYSDFRQSEGDTIIQLIAPYKDKRIVYEINIDVNRPRLSSEPEAPESYFAKLAQESDAVIRGKVTSRLSQVTEDRKFLFTDYDVTIEEVLKNSSGAPLGAGATITVTCPGGKVLIGDVVVKTGGNAIASLPANNHDLLLFVTSIPEAGDYKLTRYDGSFELGTSVRALAGEYPTTYPRDKHSFLETVRAVANK